MEAAGRPHKERQTAAHWLRRLQFLAVKHTYLRIWTHIHPAQTCIQMSAARRIQTHTTTHTTFHSVERLLMDLWVKLNNTSLYLSACNVGNMTTAANEASDLSPSWSGLYPQLSHGSQKRGSAGTAHPISLHQIVCCNITQNKWRRVRESDS